MEINLLALFKLDRTGTLCQILINGLAGCGLNASQTSNDDLRVILDNFLNGGQTTKFGTVVTEE